MSSAIANLRNRSKSSFQKLQEQVQKENSQNSFNDERFWTLSVDGAGNGSAVIRFLPAIEDDPLPWAKYYSHSFKIGPTWFIEDCPTTIGGKCPVCEDNSKHWNSGVDSDKKIASERKRKISYVSNILVISDPKNSDNDGKVFLFRYGAQIYAKIHDKLSPEFEDQDKMDVFSFWEGANFRLRVRKNEGGWPNYEKSEFDSASVLSDDDDYLEKLYATQYSLAEFTNPQKFKTYSELETAFIRVVSGGNEASERDSNLSERKTQLAPATPKKSTVATTKIATKKQSEIEDEISTTAVDDNEDEPPFDLEGPTEKSSVIIDEDDDDIDYFKKLAQS